MRGGSQEGTRNRARWRFLPFRPAHSLPLCSPVPVTEVRCNNRAGGRPNGRSGLQVGSAFGAPSSRGPSTLLPDHPTPPVGGHEGL